MTAVTGEIYAGFREDVFRLIYMMTGSRVVSEEVTQAVFRAARGWETPKTQLLAAARKMTLLIYKREKRPVPLEGTLPYRGINDLDFLDVLCPLTLRQREVVLYRFLFSLPHSETAKIMDMSHTAVRKEYDRAEEILRFVERKKEEFPDG